MNELKPRVAEQATCSAKPELAEIDVMRALECCVKHHINECKKCPYSNHTHCFGSLQADALALLREKDVIIKEFEHQSQIALKRLAEKDAEIERLQNGLVVSKKETKRYITSYKQTRAEAITEFAERLKAACDAPHWCVWLSDIEEIAKEMKEKNI